MQEVALDPQGQDLMQLSCKLHSALLRISRSAPQWLKDHITCSLMMMVTAAVMMMNY